MDSPEYFNAIYDCNLDELIATIDGYVADQNPLLLLSAGIPVSIDGMMKHTKRSGDVPQAGVLLYNAGNECVRQDRYPFAIEVYKQAIARGNTEPSVYNNIASSHKRLGQYEEAMTVYENCIAKNPSYTPAYARAAILIKTYRLKSQLTPVQYLRRYFAKGGNDEQLLAFSQGLPSNEQGAIDSILVEMGRKEETDFEQRRQLNKIDQMFKLQAEIMREAFNGNMNESVKPLFQAIAARKIDDAIKIIKNDSRLIHCVDESGSYPLHEASRLCLLSVVACILDHGGATNVRDRYNQTPLHSAACQPVIQTLLDHGANIEDRDDSGWTPLYAIARDGHTDSARYLIHKGAKINVCTNPDARFGQGEWSPLHIAVHKQHTEVVRMLLANGTDVDAISTQKETPFQVANDDEMRELLRKGKLEIIEARHSKEYISANDKSLIIALRQLPKRYKKLEWGKSKSPYVVVAEECRVLMRNAEFKENITRYLRNYPDVERALRIHEESLRRQWFSSWSDLPKNFNDPVWHRFFVDRWRPAFLMLDSPMKHLYANDAPLHWRNLPMRCPNFESATWLFHQHDFWAVRHSFAHPNYEWKMVNNESYLAAYSESESIRAQLSILEAESFAVIISSFVSILLDTIVSQNEL